ncbi:hypothetical protein E4U54_006845, partial [Claviceps lovelessii]
ITIAIMESTQLATWTREAHQPPASGHTSSMTRPAEQAVSGIPTLDATASLLSNSELEI